MFDKKPENQWMNPLVVRFAGFIRCQSAIIVSAHSGVRSDVVGVYCEFSKLLESREFTEKEP